MSSNETKPSAAAVNNSLVETPSSSFAIPTNNNRNHNHTANDDASFVVVESNNTGGAASQNFSHLYSDSTHHNSTTDGQKNKPTKRKYAKRNADANFTELQNDDDAENFEGDGVELIADDDDDDNDDVAEPTSTTNILAEDSSAAAANGEKKNAEEGEKDQVHDISSIIPPDTFNCCGKFEISTDTIWYLNLLCIFAFGIIFGIALAPVCSEFYSKELLIPSSGSGDENGGSDFLFISTSTSTSTTTPSPSQASARDDNTDATTTRSPNIVALYGNHTITKKKIKIKDDVSASDCNWALLSSCLGFISFFAWVISFVPQLYVNWQRKSIVGQSIAFAYTNFLGFSCYSLFNICLYSFDSIKMEYQERFHTRNDVELNDVLYAIFSAICTGINSYQCFVYERGGQKVHKIVPIFIWGSCALLIGWSALILFFYDSSKPSTESPYLINPLDFLYGVGILKVIVTAVKYAPQVLLNFKRKKTVGMSISQWVMDFIGGTFSLSQELLDADLRDEWVALEGNFVKLLLCVLTIFYDILFFIQHYCMYAENNEKIINEYKRKMRIQRVRELVAGDEEEGRNYS